MVKQLVVGTVSQTQPAVEMVCLSIASLPEAIRSLRRQVVEFFSSSPLSEEELADVKLAVGEACTNAVKHGSPRGEFDEVRVMCVRSERALVVEVSDAGHGFDPDSLEVYPSDELREGGLGILLMRSLMDSVEFEFAGGTTVRLVKHW